MRLLVEEEDEWELAKFLASYKLGVRRDPEAPGRRGGGGNEDGSNDVFIVKDAAIPAGTSLEVMAGNKLVLQNDGTNADNLEAIASATSSLDVTVSVLEDV